MRSSRNIKEMQQLASRIMALSHFLSRSIKTALSIFHYLKKSERFMWTKESEEAFQKMKTMLATPPILTRSTPGWTIQLFELDISFERRGHIKAQALADFMTKLASIDQGNNNGKEWFLSVDGASNQRGSRVSVILEGPVEY
ncbi:hypothetical protein CR513_59159, partial [Mucuna pruriens]